MFLDINGNSIYYEVYGAGIPVVTIHGFTVDHRVMKGFLEEFIPADNYKRIYFDLPGMGKTKTNKQLYKAEEMYEIIKHFIRQVIGGEKYILAGESYGGYLMRKLIKDEPEKILGAMFICPVVIPEHAKRNCPEHKIMYNGITDNRTRESEVYKGLTEAAAFMDRETLENFEKNVFPGMEIADLEFLPVYSGSGYGFTENVDDIREPFRKPVLFLLGKQDHVVGYRDAEKIMDNYPRASVCVLDESGHNLQIEKRKIAEVLALDWLERIERVMETEGK